MIKRSYFAEMVDFSDFSAFRFSCLLEVIFGLKLRDDVIDYVIYFVLS